MNDRQVAITRTWTGPRDERYFAAIEAADVTAVRQLPQPVLAPEAPSAPAETPPSTRPKPRNVGTSPEPRDVDAWLVERVLRPGAYVVVAAPEGLGKSFIRKELAFRLATGTGALFGHYAISGAAVVLEFDEENGDREEWRREEDVLAALGLERAALDGRYWSVSFAGLTLTDAGSHAYVRELVDNLRPGLVMFDTGTGMVGDEWGAELKVAVRFLRSLAVDYGTAVLVFVHLVKPSRDSRAKGARHGTAMTDVMGQWTRQADAVALMSDLGDGRAGWTMRKRVPPSSLVIRQADGVWETVNVNAAEAARSSSVDDRILRAVAASATTARELAVGLGVPERTIYAAVKRLRRDGYLEGDFPYQLTRAGAEAAEAA